MNDVLLGLIAFGVLVMAIIQVAAIVFAARAARQVGEVVTRFETEVKPLVTNLQALTADAARVTARAAAQVERAERLLEELSARVDETAAALQDAIVRPAREGYAVLQGLMSAFSVFRAGPQAARRQPAAESEEDAMFIG